MDENTLLKERITNFREKNIVCHIITTKDYHYNGRILKQDDTHILINDRIEGEKLIPISDIKTADKSKRRNSNV